MTTNTQALIDQLTAMNLPIIDPSETIQPPNAVRESLFDKVFPPRKVDSFLKSLPEANSQAIVVSDYDGIIEWVSPAFTRMCGYKLSELRGNKAGKMLQGEETDPAAVEILRSGLRDQRSVHTTIVNYHKCGDHYEVNIELFPTYDEIGNCTGYIAVEKELPQIVS